MTLQTAQTRLFRLWFYPATFGFVLVTAQWLGGKYGDDWQGVIIAYIWLASWTAPLGLMIVASPISMTPPRSEEIQNPALYRCCFYGSAVFLATVLSIPLSEPWLSFQITDLFTVSSLMFLVFQGIISHLILKLFFV